MVDPLNCVFVLLLGLVPRLSGLTNYCALEHVSDTSSSYLAKEVPASGCQLLGSIISSSKHFIHLQGWKFTSFSHSLELGQQASWLLISYTRVNNHSEARSSS